jgi:hypothetical protein
LRLPRALCVLIALRLPVAQERRLRLRQVFPAIPSWLQSVF